MPGPGTGGIFYLLYKLSKMNKFFYSVTYHLNLAGKRTKEAKILFSSLREVTTDQIKRFILKKLEAPNALITFHSINTFPKTTFVHLGGNPDEPFE
jgi:hypothetical protein